MKNYEEKYKEALKVMESLYNIVKYQSSSDALLTCQTIEKAFPELKESEDERIRKMLIEQMKRWRECALGNNVVQDIKDTADAIAWLERQSEQSDANKEYWRGYNEGKQCIIDKYAEMEKQGEQKPIETDMEFKAGDWIVCFDNEGEISIPEKVVDFFGNKVRLVDIDGMFMTCPKSALKQYRLWTIQDVKDGDVLYCENHGTEFIVMNKGVNENGNIDSYFRYNSKAGFDIDVSSVLSAYGDIISPATKEQRDFLFKKMKEAGYEWDVEKKELKKIEEKPTWSEEDERNLKGIITEIEANKNDAPDYDIATYDRFLSWLQSIKDRVQPKQERSEEDKIALDDALWCCKQAASIAKDENDMGNIWYAENWLKSLRPQNHWMPSEEEINALTEVAFINESAVGKERKMVLEELIEKLKTLRDYE